MSNAKLFQVQRPRIDNTVVKALARAFRWKRLLEQGAYSSVTELAEKENIGMSYLTRVLRMTLLSMASQQRKPKIKLPVKLEP